jgi:hypothetical protein
MRESRSATDAGHKNGSLGWELLIPAESLDGGQNSVVATPRAPSRNGPLVCLQRFVFIVEVEDALCL